MTRLVQGAYHSRSPGTRCVNTYCVTVNVHFSSNYRCGYSDIGARPVLWDAMWLVGSIFPFLSIQLQFPHLLLAVRYASRVDGRRCGIPVHPQSSFF